MDSTTTIRERWYEENLLRLQKERDLKERSKKRKVGYIKFDIEYDENLSKKDRQNKYLREKGAVAKDLVINFYSKGKNICNCCGESMKCFLSIDHIDGGGSKHRRDTKTRGGKKFYIWLVRNNYPDGYQVLCFNCNFGKSSGPCCPHKIVDNANK